MMTATAQATWRNPRILTTILLVFLAGAACGALSMRLGLSSKLHRVSASSKEAKDAKDASRDAVLQNFKNKLDLTTDQTQQIAVVLEDYRHYYESLEDQLEDIRSTGKNRILQILNPAQRDQFEKVMTELAPQLQSGKQ
jgi:Spy/CpxP family protein refolding chaperone